MTLIERASYPAILESFKSIQQDNGGAICDNPNNQLAHECYYVVQDQFDYLVKVSESALSKLTEDELELLCTGEHNDQFRLCHSKGIELRLANVLLTAFFDGWELSYEECIQCFNTYPDYWERPLLPKFCSSSRIGDYEF